MNFGLIVRNALQRAELPFDTEHLELGRSYANDNIQDLWQMTKADIRQKAATLSMVAGQDEYQLPKDYDGMVLNSLRGPSSNPRNIIYKDPIEWFRFTRNYSTSTGVPNIFTFGKLINIDSQSINASTVRVASSLANYATGTVTTANGSNRIIGSATTFTLNMVGLYFQKSGDVTTYKISKFISTTEVQLDENYRGASGAGATYAIGDVGIKVSITGSVDGQEDSESVILNGTTVQTTTKKFDAGGLSAVVKSDLTGGIVTANGVTISDILTDGALEVWTSAALLTNWTLDGANAVLAREATLIKEGTYSAKLTRVGATASIYQNAFVALGSGLCASRLVSVGAWVYATVGTRARLQLNDGATSTYSDYHTGSGAWEYLHLFKIMAAASTEATVSCVVDTGNTTAYFDDVQCGFVNAIATLAPAEYEIERQSIMVWRIPSSAEDLTYRYQRKHPVLRNDNDRTLILSKYHTLLSKLTEADLREWADRAIPSKLKDDISTGRMKFKADANDCSLWITLPSEEGLAWGLTDVGNRALDQDFVG